MVVLQAARDLDGSIVLALAFLEPLPIDVIGDAPVGVLDEDLKSAALKALAIPRADARAFAESFTWTASADQFLEYLPSIQSAKR